MKIQVWHVSGNGFHFGRHGLGQEESSERLPSDSLYAALVSRLIELRGNAEVTSWANQFLRPEPPFLLTSVFPCAGQTRLYPIPLQKSQLITEPEIDANIRPMQDSRRYRRSAARAGPDGRRHESRVSSDVQARGRLRTRYHRDVQRLRHQVSRPGHERHARLDR